MRAGVRKRVCLSVYERVSEPHSMEQLIVLNGGVNVCFLSVGELM